MALAIVAVATLTFSKYSNIFTSDKNRHTNSSESPNQENRLRELVEQESPTNSTNGQPVQRAATTSTTNKIDSNQFDTYTNIPKGVKMSYPRGWEVDEQPENGELVLIYDRQKAAIYPPNISIAILPANNLNLEEYIDQNLITNPDDEWSEYTSTNFNPKKKVTLNDGRDAYYIEGSSNFVNSQLRVHYLLTKNQDNIYQVSCNYLTDNSLDEIIKESLLSFELTQ